MQRSIIIVALVVVFAAGAQADETPPQNAAKTVPDSGPAVLPPRNAAAIPSPAAPETATPSADTPPPGTATPSAVPPPPGNAAPSAVPPPPATAVQSVAPDSAEAILGQRVTDAEGKEIGRLVDVLVNASGQPQAAIIDFGGFMGVGNRKIAVHWSVIHFSPGDPKHKVTLDMTPDQIKTAPEFLNVNKAASVVTPSDPTSASP